LLEIHQEKMKKEGDRAKAEAGDGGGKKAYKGWNR